MRLFRLAAMCFCLIGGGSAAWAAAPRPMVNVQGNEVRLSDVFTEVDPARDHVIALSPNAGERLILDAQTLTKLAQENGLNWQPLRDAERSVITRQSQKIGAAEIAAAVQAALALPHLPQGHYEVVLSNPLITLHMPTDVQAELQVADAQYDANAQRFTATALLQNNGETIDQLPVTGRIITKMQLPVLARPVRRGEVIAAQDIAWQEMTVDSSLGQALFNAEDIIGKSPRTMARAGVALRSADLLTPATVKRGSLVTMIVQQGSMQLTAQGRALNDAALGEAVKVVNSTTSRTVEGVVVDAGTVRVGAAPAPAAPAPMAAPAMAAPPTRITTIP